MSFFAIILMNTPMTERVMAYSTKSKAPRAEICAVTVEPMLAPMITVVACERDISPALTKPTTMTVVTEELCTIAVETAPIPTPASLLFAVLPNIFFRLPDASFSMLSLNKRKPIRKTPSPANKLMIAVMIIISPRIDLSYPVSLPLKTRSRFAKTSAIIIPQENANCKVAKKEIPKISRRFHFYPFHSFLNRKTLKIRLFYVWHSTGHL